MKLGPVTKRDKGNMSMSKKIDDDVMSVNCDVIAIFRIYGQSGAIRRRIPDAWSVKLTFSLRVTFYLTKAVNRIKKSLTKLSYYCFE